MYSTNAPAAVVPRRRRLGGQAVFRAARRSGPTPGGSRYSLAGSLGASGPDWPAPASAWSARRARRSASASAATRAGQGFAMNSAQRGLRVVGGPARQAVQDRACRGPRSAGAGRQPRSLAAAACSMTQDHRPGRRSLWVMAKVSGRPDARLTASIQASSAARVLPGPRRRARRSAARPRSRPGRGRRGRPAMAGSSSGRRTCRAAGVPSGTVCRKLREVEKPSAPASIASASTRRHAARSRRRWRAPRPGRAPP